MGVTEQGFDVFLSHSHQDGEWVDALAHKLEDERHFSVWLDKWILIPGKSWQQAMARGLDEAAACAVCIGGKTPTGWFREEIERALDLQARDTDFRVIPVLLPDATIDLIPAFLPLRTWADFRNGKDTEYAFHVLSQGIKGEPVGRWPPSDEDSDSNSMNRYQQKLVELRGFRGLIHDEVVIEFERKILEQWIDE